MNLLLKVALLVCLFLIPAKAQEGHHGHGHETWHKKFYDGLLRNDTKTSCCNLSDCRPTSVRIHEGAYEVMVDGEWVRADQSVIQNKLAPDWGAHVCAPKQEGTNKGVLYCVVLPPEI